MPRYPLSNATIPVATNAWLPRRLPAPSVLMSWLVRMRVRICCMSISRLVWMIGCRLLMLCIARMWCIILILLLLVREEGSVRVWREGVSGILVKMSDEAGWMRRRQQRTEDQIRSEVYGAHEASANAKASTSPDRKPLSEPTASLSSKDGPCGRLSESADVQRKTSIIPELRQKLSLIRSCHHTQDGISNGPESGPVKQHSQNMASTRSGSEERIEHVSQD